MVPEIPFWAETNQTGKPGGFCVCSPCSEAKTPHRKTRGSSKAVPFFCGLLFAPQTNIPPPGRSMRAIQALDPGVGPAEVSSVVILNMDPGVIPVHCLRQLGPWGPKSTWGVSHGY